MVLRNAFADLATDLTVAAMRDTVKGRFDPVRAASATYTTAGNNTLLTPATGKSLRVTWLYAQAKGALDTGTVLVTLSLAALGGGTNTYVVELTGSQPFAHSAVWEGAVNAPLIVNTSSTAAVIVNADYREF